MSDRVKEKIEFLKALSDLHEKTGRLVFDEISELINEIRVDLGIAKKKEDVLKRKIEKEFEKELRVLVEKDGNTFEKASSFQSLLLDLFLKLTKDTDARFDKIINVPYVRGTGASTGLLALKEMFYDVIYIGTAKGRIMTKLEDLYEIPKRDKILFIDDVSRISQNALRGLGCKAVVRLISDSSNYESVTGSKAGTDLLYLYTILKGK